MLRGREVFFAFSPPFWAWPTPVLVFTALDLPLQDSLLTTSPLT